MSATYWYTKSDDMYYDSSTGYGALLKSLIAHIVNNDPNLEIESTVTDTSSVYKVYLRISGTNGGFYFYNSNGTVYYYRGAWTDTGTWVSSGGSSSNGLYSGQAHYAVSFGIENCYCGFQFGHNYTSYGMVYARYATFTSDTTDGLQAAVYCSTTTTRPVAAVSLFEVGYMYWLNPASGALEGLYATESLIKNTLYRSGCVYAWSPYWEHLYSTNMGMINVKWGGSYKAKVLYSNNGILGVTPNQQVLVDGETIAGMDYILVFE